MNRDPFYQDIVGRLNGSLDPRAFEECATDLLKKVYPTLVPIRGGSDAGMDGAIADGQGPPIPLICTTAADASGNLRASLTSYKTHGGKRDRAVFATPRRLTPTRQWNLQAAAGELGFILVQVFEQAWFAAELYRHPEWCKELLGLTGEPPPLSKIPVSMRPLIAETVVGREDDLAWLRDTPGDVLLIGQPGSGKTFLFRLLARAGEGLFVVDEDRGRIAAGVRSQEPTILFLDDAHIRQPLLSALRHLREEISGTFRIVANCWPGERDAVLKAMGITGNAVRELGLLTRDQVVQVIHSCGIGGPTDLVRELVNQANGKPGLAVTLCHICLQGNIQDFASGTALCRDIKTTFEPLLRRLAIDLLAALSIGGERGMQMAPVATELGVSPGEAGDILAKLAVGGVLHDLFGETLSVRPSALRHALVADRFFRGATSLPIQRLIAMAPDSDEVARTLVGARARTGGVPPEIVTSNLERAYTDKPWAEFASLGPAESSYVLENHPEKLVVVASEALLHVPEKTIPMLLEAAVGDDRELHSHLDHPLRMVGDWVQSARPGTGAPVERRRLLLNSASRWLARGGNLGVSLKALKFCLSPAFEAIDSDPGSEMSVTISFGCVTLQEIAELQGLWPAVLEVVRTHETDNWGPLLEAVETWAYPGVGRINLPDEQRRTMRAFAVRMLADLAPLMRNRPGFLHWANRIAGSLDGAPSIAIDPEFSALYPPRVRGDWQETYQKNLMTATKLGQCWCAEDPRQVAAKLRNFSREAKAAGVTGLSYGAVVCGEIAKHTDQPQAWVHALLDAGTASGFVAPFLERIFQRDPASSVGIARECLERAETRADAIQVILAEPTAPDVLVRDAIARLVGLADFVCMLCIQGRIPAERVSLLLRHEDPAIAAAAARGMRQADPKRGVAPCHESDWRAAILKCRHDEYDLVDIFKADPALAFDWLKEHITEASQVFLEAAPAIQQAIDVLNADQRKCVLDLAPEGARVGDLVIALTRGDIDVYRHLLGIRRLKEHHLAPLEGQPGGRWVERARLALDAGYTPEDVARSAFGGIRGWTGSEAAMWADWVRGFESLLTDSDSRVQEVGRLGCKWALSRQERAAREERDEDIYGLH